RVRPAHRGGLPHGRPGTGLARLRGRPCDVRAAARGVGCLLGDSGEPVAGRPEAPPPAAPPDGRSVTPFPSPGPSRTSMHPVAPASRAMPERRPAVAERVAYHPDDGPD